MRSGVVRQESSLKFRGGEGVFGGGRVQGSFNHNATERRATLQNKGGPKAQNPSSTIVGAGFHDQDGFVFERHPRLSLPLGVGSDAVREISPRHGTRAKAPTLNCVG